MENNKYHSLSQRQDVHSHLLSLPDGKHQHPQQHQSNQTPDAEKSHQRASQSINHPQTRLALDHDDQRNSSSNDIKSIEDESSSSKHYTKNDYYGYWMKETNDSQQQGEGCDTFEQYIDGISRNHDDTNSSFETIESNINSNKSSNLTNSSQDSDSFRNNQQFNDSVDLVNESMDSYQSNKLNETYSISQDNESDYSIGLRRSSSGLTIHGQGDLISHKPKLRDIEDLLEREKLFEHYIDECCKVYDFRNEQMDDLDSRDNKTVILSEFFEVLVEEPELLAQFDSLYDQIFRMFSLNVFRPLPPANQNAPEFDPEEDDPPLEPAWPHLQLVYHVLLRFTGSPLFESDRAKRYIDEKFVLKLLQLFESEDPRERSYLKSIIHRIYGQFLSLRSYIRRQIGNIFTTFIYENEYHNGIADLLEILGSIINGFVQPLKQEHKVFLLKVLMPLHKARHLNAFHAQLSICIVQYIEKDPTLTKPIVDSLLRYWPKVHSPKEVLFLNQVEEILDIIEPVEFQKIMITLFRRLARCISSTQFQVAERVLYFWNNEYILSLINDNVHTILPIVMPALHVDPKLAHWNKTIHGLIYNALKLSTQMNQKLFHDLVQEKEKQMKQRALSLEDKDRKWRRIQEMAEENANKMKFTIN